ncbi:hypothetical protein GW17_00026037 [Ensete ventricosum]|nr:hypothetical protein GW17_00026037 [Ensete ventricosum]
MLPMPIGGLPKGAVPASTASTGVAPPLRALTLLAVSPATVAPTSDHPYRGHGYSLPPLAMGGRPCRGPVCSIECAYRSAASVTLSTAQADVGSDARRQQPHQAVAVHGGDRTQAAVATCQRLVVAQAVAARR